MAVKRDKILRNAEKLVQKGKVEQAISEYEKVLQENPNDANTINRIGDLYGRVGQVDKAVELYERIAEHFTADGFTTKAIAILKKINRLAPQKLEIFSRLAELYIQQGLVVEAKNQYQLLADWYRRNEDFDNAIEAHEKLVQLDPNNHTAHLRLADLFMQGGKANQAVEAYDRLGRMLIERKKLDEAEQLYRHAVEQNPPTGEFLAPLCSALVEAGRGGAAREFLDAALSRSPDCRELQVLQIRTLLHQGETESALKASETILAVEPDNDELRQIVGRALLAAGEAGRARDLLVPTAEAFLERGNFLGAQGLLKDLLKAMPQDATILTLCLRAFKPAGDKEMLFTLKAALADCRFRSRNTEEAHRLYLELLDEDPSNELFRQRIAKIENRAPETPAQPQKGAAAAAAEESLAEDEIDVVEIAEEEEIEFFDEMAEQPAADEQPPAAEPEFSPEEKMAEANVFAKYGLAEKAITYLARVVDAYPEYWPAREKLVALLVEIKQEGKALAIAKPLVDHYLADNETEPLEELLTLLPDLGNKQQVEQAAPATPAAEQQVPQEPAVEPDDDLMIVDFDETGELAPEVSPAEIEEPVAFEAPEEFEIVDDTLEVTTGDIEIIEEVTAAEDGELEIVEETDAAAVDEYEIVDEEEIDQIEYDEISFEEVGIAEDDEDLVVIDADDGVQVEDFEQESGAGETTEQEEPKLGAESEEEEVISFDQEVELAPEPLAVAPSKVTAQSHPEAGQMPPAPESMGDNPFEEIDDLERSLLGDLAAGFRKPEAELEPAEQPEAVETPEPVAEVSQAAEEELVEISDTFTGPSFSDLEKLDFFIEQELNEDALKLLERLEQEFSGDPDVAERRLVLKNRGIAVAQANMEAKSEPEALFADEDEFIDIAQELEQELAEEDAIVEEATGSDSGEAELEEVFREFQKGVAEQLSEEDSDTHFNLGIAYREMGLLPEAIREFQVASRDASFFVECCSMIGVCYLEQGMSSQAAEWYRKALQAPELSAEAIMALQYDLAAALEAAGDMGEAQGLYTEISAADPTYRDVTDRLDNLAAQQTH